MSGTMSKKEKIPSRFLLCQVFFFIIYSYIPIHIFMKRELFKFRIADTRRKISDRLRSATNEANPSKIVLTIHNYLSWRFGSTLYILGLQFLIFLFC